MIRRILILTVLVAASVYLVLAVTVFNAKPPGRLCESMDLEIMDDVDYKFMTRHDLENVLKNRKLLPAGERLKDIDIGKIETELEKNPFIKEVECYITDGGNVKIEIYQRIPLLKVMSNTGDNYYIDNEGKVMNAGGKAVYVAVVTGHVDRKNATDRLFRLACFLKSDKFWNAQIEQINVTSEQEIELVPRVGDHILFIGKPEMLDVKFRKLKTFYTEGLNKVGWNKYRRISVEFNNQIICTKKE